MNIKIINKKYNADENAVYIDYVLINKDKQIIYTASMRDDIDDDAGDVINQHFKYDGSSYGEWQDHDLGEEQ